MKNQALTQLTTQLGYQFKEAARLKEALTHRSAGAANNERLEFLGDSVLNFAITDLLYAHFKQLDEGQLSRLRASLVKGDCLADIALELHLGDVLILGPGESRAGGQRRASILADTLEAILGAIYLEAGYDTLKQVIMRLYKTRLQDPHINEQVLDHKSYLQEQLQAKKCPLPDYQLTRVTGELHDQHFFVTCTVSITDHVAKGEGLTRRKAEQAAAEEMIIYLQLKKHFTRVGPVSHKKNAHPN